MGSAESRLNPDQTMQRSDDAGVMRPIVSGSKEGRNTTTLSQAESLLAAEKRTLEMTANGASLSEVLNDSDGNFLCANQALLKYTSLTKEEMKSGILGTDFVKELRKRYA